MRIGYTIALSVGAEREHIRRHVTARVEHHGVPVVGAAGII